ncbi:MAG TPA: outer membrane beta-barrel family protein, partial [Chitinophagaceae bacterium]
ITFNRGKNKSENLMSSDYYTISPKNFLRSFDQVQRSNGTNEFMVFQTDYAQPLNDRSKLEIGARMQVRNVDNNQIFRMINNGTEMAIPYQEDVLYSSTDKIYAAYGNYSSKIKNFGFQLGLRAESSDYEGNLLSKAQQFNIEFPISFFPSIFLSQKINDRNDLQLNYSRRINRPNFWQLLPFTDYSDSLNINRGNPNLNPEFTNSIELSYNKQFENRDNLMASIYFKNTNDLITRFQTLDTLNEKLLINSFINANRSYVTGLELIGRNKITKFWDLTTNANFFTSKIELEDQPDPDQFLSYFIKINNSFKLPKNFTVQLSGDYTSKIISSPGGTGGGRSGGGGMHMGGGSTSASQGYISPNYGVDAAVRFEFLKNRTASLSLNVNDIFRTKKYDAYSESPFFIQNVERRRDPQVFRLNFNYRFGKFDASLFKRKNTRSEDVQMDMGGM